MSVVTTVVYSANLLALKLVEMSEATKVDQRAVTWDKERDVSTVALLVVYSVAQLVF